MTNDSDYSIRRPDWPQEIPGLIHVPRDKDDRRTPRRGRKKPSPSARGTEPPPPPPATTGDGDGDEGETHLVDYLA